jgi:hypothetical protein
VRIDFISLASGAVLAALGALVLLDSAGALDLSVGWIATAFTGGAGAILLVAGLARGDGNGR